MTTSEPYGFDSVIAIGESGLNKGFTRLFSKAQLAEELKLKGENFELNGTMGVPQLSFVPDPAAPLRLKIPFTGGTVKIAKKKKQTDLAGKSVSFSVHVNRINHEYFHDSAFTIAGIYLELTQISNIDAQGLGFDAEDLGSIREIVHGLIQKMQAASLALQDDSAPGRLFLGQVAVPKVPDTVGPFAPTAAAMAVSMTRRNPPAGELDFLLMMHGRKLPAADDLFQRGFENLWTYSGAAAGKHDAALVITDYLLLEAIAAPALKKAFPGIAINITRGSDAAPSKLKLSKRLPIAGQRGTALTAASAQLDGAALRLDLQLDVRERLQTADGPAGIDFSLITVVLSKKLTFKLQFRIGDDGQLTFNVVPGPANRKDPKPAFETNFEIHGIKDILKYLGAPLAVLAGPFAAPYIVALMACVLAIQSGIVDALKFGQYAGVRFSPIEDITMPLALPGDPVFGFHNPERKGNCLVFAADYVDPPKLRDSKDFKKPFNIKPFPKVKSVNKRQPPEDTEPETIGEVAIKYRHVSDDRYKDDARQAMPYYILKREQYWHRLSDQRYAAHAERKSTQETIKRTKTLDKRTLEDTLKMEFTATGTVSFLESFAPELKAEISHELQITTETESEQEWTETITHEITHEARDTPYGLAVWILADRFTLSRTDKERSPVGQWTIYNHDYIQTDDYELQNVSSAET